MILAADNLTSTNRRVLARGLAACLEKPSLNGVTREAEKPEGILPLAAALETQVILFLLDARSHPPPSLEGRLAVAAGVSGLTVPAST